MLADACLSNAVQGMHSNDMTRRSADIEESQAVQMQDVLDVSVLRSAAAAKRVGKKWYFEHLDIHGIKCNLTLIPKSMHSEDVGPQRARLTTVFGVHFMDINNVSLRINALQMRNAFVTWRSLLAQIYRHLFFQVSFLRGSSGHRILRQCCVPGVDLCRSAAVLNAKLTSMYEPANMRNKTASSDVEVL